MNAIPQYGLVKWLDATTHTGKKPKNPRKRLYSRTAVGMLALAADGTLVIIHEFDSISNGMQRGIEGSIIPMGWIQEIVPLLPPAGGSNAVHKAEPPRTA